MGNLQHFFARYIRSAGHYCLPVLLTLFGLIVPIPFACAQNQQEDGLFLTVPVQINEEAVERIREKVRRAVVQEKRSIRVVVFDFNPNGQPAASGYFGGCLELKDYIHKLGSNQVAELKGVPHHREVLTVAFVHDKVSKHTVLPVLACKERILSENATMGNVLDGQPINTMSDEIRAAYDSVTTPATVDVVWKMIDSNMVLMKLAKLPPEFVSKRKVDDHPAWKKYKPKVAIGPEQTIFTADQLEEFGLTGAERAKSRLQLQTRLGLNPRSLKEDWLAGQTKVPWLLEVHGDVDAGNMDSLKRRLNHAVRDGANLVMIKLNCTGGKDFSLAAETAEFLIGLKTNKGHRVQTIAYIPPGKSLGVGTLLALGCMEIYMANNAALGDFSAFAAAGPEELASKRKILMELVEKHGYPPLLFRATLDPKLQLVKVTTVGGPFVLQQRNAGNLDTGELQKKNNGPFLKIDASTAQEWGVSLANDVNSQAELFAQVDVDPNRVTYSSGDWLDAVVGFLRHPIVIVVLLLIAVAGLILEIQMPGFGAPGIIAAICFVLFFWSASFGGSASITMLAIFLFLLGLVLLAVEVFIFPGFGVTGISGILLVVVGLSLASLQKMPSTSQDWMEVGYSLGTFAISLVGGIILAIAISSFLPHIPYANRLMLVPPDELDEAETNKTELNAQLLGAIGMTETPLRPAGKARFGDDYHDVVSEGEYVNPGNRVQIIEIEGNRIVVKPV